MVELPLSQISESLTKEVLNEVFKIKSNSSDFVKSVEVSRATAAGEGFISAVYRVNVTGAKHTASFIVKGLVNDALLRRSLNCQKYFKREALFFTKILPILSEVQAISGAKESISNHIPIVYKCHIDGNNDYILMEDLSECNAKTVSTYPTKKEIDMILQGLAHFHAVSVALRIKNPQVYKNLVNELHEVYYNEENRSWYSNYLLKAVEIVKNVVEEYENSDSIYYQKMYELLESDLYGELIRVAQSRGDNPVINHGDAWCQNFLCCNDRLVTIDFQLLGCCSPATDLSYFMLSSNVCRNKKEFFDVLKVYHRFLEYYLLDMGLDANQCLSLDSLKNEFKEYGKFGLIRALTSIPLLASEQSDDLQSFKTKYYDKIPLEQLWRLTPMESEKPKLSLMNAIHVAVDVGLI